MQGRVNRRVNKCLHVLLRLARDKSFDRLVKLKKGKNTSRLSIIHAQHKASLEPSSKLVIYIYSFMHSFESILDVETTG